MWRTSFDRKFGVARHQDAAADRITEVAAMSDST